MPAVRSSILLSVILFFYFPGIVYRENSDFFESSFGYIALFMIPAFLATTAFFSFPSLLLNAKWKERYTVGLASLAFVGWFIGNFLVVGGLLDGQQGLKPDPVPYQWVELICGILAFVLLLVSGLKWPKVHGNLALFLILVTAGLALIIFITDKRKYEFQNSSNENIRASSSKNVFVFILDAFQSDIFAAILKDNPSLLKELEGFTFFKNTASVAPTTYLSMPAIHSGMAYKLNQSIPDYYNEGIRKNSFLARLSSAGYEASIINSVGPCPIGVSCAELAELMDSFWLPVIRDATLLLDISIYRFVPSFFKSAVYNDGDWRISNLKKVHRIGSDIKFFSSLGDHLLPFTDRPVVRFIHLYITHPPAQIDSDCGLIERRKWFWASAKAQSECAVTLFTGWLGSLKKNGLYDKSLIVLLSDHGGGVMMRPEPKMVARAKALLLIKPLNAQGELRSSDRLMQIGDVPKTVCELTQDCEYSDGTNAFGNLTQSRSLSFLEYRWKHEYWTTNAVPIDAVWRITGPVGNILSWYKQISPQHQRRTSLDFSRKEPNAVFGFGWGPHDRMNKRRFRWAGPSSAQIFLPLPQKQDAKLEVTVYTLPSITNQTMTLYLDDLRIASSNVLPEWQMISFDLQGESIVNPFTRLTFEFKKITTLKTKPVATVAVAFDALNVLPQ